MASKPKRAPKRKPLKLRVYAIVQDDQLGETLFEVTRNNAIETAKYLRGYPKHCRIVKGHFVEDRK